MKPARELIVASLAAHGARRVFGDPLGNLAAVPVSEPTLAAALADADGRLHRVGAAYRSATQTLRLSSRIGTSGAVTEICSSPQHIVRVVEAAARDVARNHRAHVIRLDFDLDAPIPSAARPVGARDYVPYPGALVDPSVRLALLAGPYVTRRDSVAALHSLAARANIGVANTWGAKGLFRWDSPHHMGTVGLQARDFELVFAGVDVVLSTGIDADEARPPMPAGIEVITVDPQQLGSLAAHIKPRTAIEPNPLYGALGAVAQPGYVDRRVPHHPARVVQMLREQLPPGGLISADPGRIGLWIARTFPTTELGSVVVPATGGPGAAAAVAACAALDGRVAVVATAERSELQAQLVEWSTSRSARIIESIWDGPDLAIDWSLDAALIDAAGECVAF